jgi:hypothetical protein
VIARSGAEQTIPCNRFDRRAFVTGALVPLQLAFNG